MPSPAESDDVYRMEMVTDGVASGRGSCQVRDVRDRRRVWTDRRGRENSVLAAAVISNAN